jgi:signal transduction histidine kinase
MTVIEGRTPDSPALETPRSRRLHGGLSSLKVRSGEIDGERLLFVLGAVLAPLGLILIGLAWLGTSGSGLVYEQVPFVVSGGLGGLACVLVGCTLYACWWATRLMREARERHTELRDQEERAQARQDALAEAIHELRLEVAALRRRSA